MKIKISLEKGPYSAGQTVKGTLNLETNKTIQLQDLNFVVHGKEYTKFYVVMGHHSMKYSNIDFFFNQDLSPFLISAGASIQQDRKLEIPNGIKDIPFNFIIPNDTPESYAGKDVVITYEILFSAHRSWKQNIDEKLVFNVIAHQNVKPISDQNLTKEEKSLNEIYVKISLERTTFSPKETLKGTVTIDNFGKKKIRNAKVILQGKEYGIGLSEEAIGLIHRKKQEKEVLNTIETYSSDIESTNDKMIPFEINIPAEAKKSYDGKFTKYFWILEVKLDIVLGSDLHILQTNMVCQ
jgi:Arrestin (or S-antigen), N-terminal domain/Arrestin (or S-antigen), C-terminal domain